MTSESVPAKAPTDHDHVRWFWEHYDDAAQQVIDFLAADDFSLEGKQVADIGSGDGVIDLGVFHKAQPAKLVGYDVRRPNLDALQRTIDAVGLDHPIPAAERFSLAKSGEDQIPAPDASFDFAYSWSAFEHVSNPIAMFSEIRRVLKPDGIFFLQIWPLYYSEHGGHLWLSYKEGFSQLLRDDAQIERDLKFEPATDPTRPADDEYRSLNRLTIDDLQRAMLAGGLTVTKLELMSEPIHIPQELARFPLSALGISGVKLLAVPAGLS